MDKFMDSPWFLRLTALILALILFFSVQSEQEKKMRSASGEMMDVIRDVPVEVFYDQQNLVVTGVPETIDVEIEGPQNIVQSTRLSKDFTALVDLTNLPLGEHYVMIQYENISDKLSVRSDPSRIKVKIEEMITETFSVEAELNEQSIGEEHYVSMIDVNPKQVEVTGAKSIIESIEYVKVSIDAEKGVTQSFEQKARVRVLDKDLNKLDVSIEPQEVSVQVEIEQFSKSLPLKIKQVGEAVPGVTIRTMTMDATSAVVYRRWSSSTRRRRGPWGPWWCASPRPRARAWPWRGAWSGPRGSAARRPRRRRPSPSPAGSTRAAVAPCRPAARCASGSGGRPSSCGCRAPC